jgi:chromosomal replication initiation ATPase DnaA
MNLNRKQINRLIDILELYAGMFGSESQEINDLVNGIKQTEMNIERIFTRQDEADKIISDVCEVAEITIDQLKSTKRNKEFVVARQLACYLIREKFKQDVTLLRIGKMMGLHHSTVIYSYRQVSQQIEMNDSLIMDLIRKLEHIDSDSIKK